MKIMIKVMSGKKKEHSLLCFFLVLSLLKDPQKQNNSKILVRQVPQSPVTVIQNS